VINVHRLHLCDVTPAPHLPWTRPTFPVFAYLVMHPAGPILIDTGVGNGDELIDELYSPVHHDLDEALARHGVSVHDVTTVIRSHLHFDHCGQNNLFPHASILVQRAEVEAASAPRYTVPAWAFPPCVELTVIAGDFEVATNVHIIATPGHTPGHQSVLIDSSDGNRTIVCCQAAWNVGSFDAATLGDDGWDDRAGTASLRKLHALAPNRVLLSHDPDEWQGRGPPRRRYRTRVAVDVKRGIRTPSGSCPTPIKGSGCQWLRAL
jgi:N-acyl homoserine lactone hydrolase